MAAVLMVMRRIMMRMMMVVALLDLRMTAVTEGDDDHNLAV